MSEARGALRKKKAELKEALAGRLHPVYQTLLKQHLEQVKLLWQQIEEINRLLGARMKEYARVLNRLCQLPGVDLGAAQQFLAEIGPRAESFASAEQFVSRVGICPGSQESAGIN